MVKFKFLEQFPVDHLPHPVMSSLILSLWHLIHSLIMWLIVSSLLSRNLYLLFCCVFSILASILLVLMAMFCAAWEIFSFSVKVVVVIIIIIIIIIFSFIFSLYNPSPGLYPGPWVKEVCDYWHSLNLSFLLPLLGNIFPSHW